MERKVSRSSKAFVSLLGFVRIFIMSPLTPVHGYPYYLYIMRIVEQAYVHLMC